MNSLIPKVILSVYTDRKTPAYILISQTGNANPPPAQLLGGLKYKQQLKLQESCNFALLIIRVGHSRNKQNIFNK